WLIVGSGGREHALGWSIAQEDIEVLYWLGNAGTSLEARGRNVGCVGDNFRALAKIVEEEDVSHIVVGPEDYLDEGIVNFFHRRGFYNIFGPKGGSGNDSAAIIESDKFFSAELMTRLGIPQADYIICSNEDESRAAIEKMFTADGGVIKARGLTKGKGVLVCDSKEEALSNINSHISSYGQDVLISERLFGQEFSVFGISDGNRIIPMEISVQDHKRLLDGNFGPNTGGMASFCPTPIADIGMVNYVTDEMMTPVVKEMKRDGRGFKGFLYAAVILTESGPEILEFNCRFGDPEMQPVAMQAESFYRPIKASLEGSSDINFRVRKGGSCCVILASNGYPIDFETGLRIGGLEEVAKMSDIKVFHSGTAFDDGNNIITNGGRVLGVSAYSPLGVPEATRLAYEAVNIIDTETTRIHNKRIFINRGDIGYSN
ncbi:phosphoribosylamine--glycine ligase, partial [archaeon]|nr:phosphoribosylamine--glycine ligase [archaeon]